MDSVIPLKIAETILNLFIPPIECSTFTLSLDIKRLPSFSPPFSFFFFLFFFGLRMFKS
jgi:hypothetical protein